MPEGLCSNCGQRLEFDEEAIGAEVACPSCGKPTVLAAAPAPASKPEPRKPGDSPPTGSPALSQCQDCGGVVSRRARTCPHCGAPISRSHRMLYVAGGVFAALALAISAFVFLPTRAKPQPPPARAPIPTIAAPAPPPVVDPDGLVEGRVFVINKDKQTVRLAAVPIQVYAEAVFQNYQRTIEPKVQATRQRIMQMAGVWTGSREKLNQTADDLNHKADLYRQESARLRYISSEYFGMHEFDTYDQYKRLSMSSNAVAKDIRGTFIKTNDNSIEASQRAMEILHTLPEAVADCYFSELPPPLASTLTDLEGKFLLKLPKAGRFVIAAQAKRPAADKEVRYFWIVSVSLEGKDSASVLLSSENLLTARNSQSPVNIFN